MEYRKFHSQSGSKTVRLFKVNLQYAFKRDGKFEHNRSFGAGRSSRGKARARLGVVVHFGNGGRLDVRNQSRVESRHGVNLSVLREKNVGRRQGNSLKFHAPRPATACTTLNGTRRWNRQRK